MKITRKDVEYVARLGRLKLSEEEIGTFTRQLDDILTYMEKLNELNTANVEPTSHAIPMAIPMRNDEIRPSENSDEVLAGAPERKQRFYKVPRVIE